MKRIVLILVVLASLVLPSAASAQPLSIVRAQLAVTRQTPGYAVDHCRRDGHAVLCNASGLWLEEGGKPSGWTATVTAFVHRAHGRIYVNLIGFTGTSSERV